jgi:hypothetical protein
VNRVVDGCVDVIESSARTFENVYNRQRRFDGSARSPADVESDEAPIRGYDALTAEQVVTKLEGMDTTDEVRDVLAYEEQHKDRKTVVAAAQSRLTQLRSEMSASPAGGD